MRDRFTVVAVCALAALALLLLAALVALGRDPTPYMAGVGLLVTPVFGALLYGEIREIKSQTNGTNSALVAMLRQQIGQPPVPVAAVNPAATDSRIADTSDVTSA